MVLTTSTIRAVIAAGGPTIVYQPITQLLEPRKVIGYEALSRFEEHGTAAWFTAAWADGNGLGVALERAALEAAVRGFRAHLGGFRSDLGCLAVNLSPRSLLDEDLRGFLRDAETDVPIHLVVELSEAQVVSDYTTVLEAVTDLRNVGLALSIDDLGAGFSSLMHVVELRPEYIKIDLRFTSHVGEPEYNAVIGGLVSIGHRIGAQIIAEGVETVEQADRLSTLGVPLGQGWWVGMPGPLPNGVE